MVKTKSIFNDKNVLSSAVQNAHSCTLLEDVSILTESPIPYAHYEKRNCAFNPQWSPNVKLSGILIAAAAYALTVLQGSEETFAASFDCTKAKLPDEIVICSDSMASRLDDIASEGYTYLKNVISKKKVNTVTKKLLKRRQSCKSDVNCVIQVQVETIKEFIKLGAPIALPSSEEFDWEPADEQSDVDTSTNSTIRYEAGDQYTGEVQNGQRNGKGVYRYKNGEVLDGNWRNDVFHGFGFNVLADGTRFEGNWIDGQLIGWGKLILPDGSMYVGEFKNGMLNGEADYYSNDGVKREQVTIENGQIVKSTQIESAQSDVPKSSGVESSEPSQEALSGEGKPAITGVESGEPSQDASSGANETANVRSLISNEYVIPLSLLLGGLSIIALVSLNRGYKIGSPEPKFSSLIREFGWLLLMLLLVIVWNIVIVLGFGSRYEGSLVAIAMFSGTFAIMGVYVTSLLNGYRISRWHALWAVPTMPLSLAVLRALATSSASSKKSSQVEVATFTNSPQEDFASGQIPSSKDHTIESNLKTSLIEVVSSAERSGEIVETGTESGNPTSIGVTKSVKIYKFNAPLWLQLGGAAFSGFILLMLFTGDITNTEWHLGTKGSPIIIPTWLMVTMSVAAVGLGVFPVFISKITDWQCSISEDRCCIRTGLLAVKKQEFQISTAQASLMVTPGVISRKLGISERIAISTNGKHYSLPSMFFSPAEFRELKREFGLT